MDSASQRLLGLKLQSEAIEAKKETTEFLLREKIRRLEAKVEESYRDKAKFQQLVEELELEQENQALKAQLKIAETEETKNDFNEEVESCHEHIAGLEKELKRKTRKLAFVESYMAERVGERFRMKARIEELEESLQKIEVRNQVLERLEIENEQLRKKNRTLNRTIQNLKIPESPSKEHNERKYSWD